MKAFLSCDSSEFLFYGLHRFVRDRDVAIHFRNRQSAF